MASATSFAQKALKEVVPFAGKHAPQALASVEIPSVSTILIAAPNLSSKLQFPQHSLQQLSRQPMYMESSSTLPILSKTSTTLHAQAISEV